MKKNFLLSTAHLEDGLWFRDEEDFITAMNYVAIEACSHPEVIVLAFILMSNHVHFILRCTRKEAIAFIIRFKRRYSMYLQRKYGCKEFLRRNDLDAKEIPDDTEALERAIAYVQMNCVAANICTHPEQYPWGTGSAFFNPASIVGERIGSMSGRSCKRMMRSEFHHFPEGWVLDPRGFILPQNYVAVRGVEAVFRSPKRMNFFLHNSSKARRRLDSPEDQRPSFRDQIILAALPDLCQSLFRKGSYNELASEEKTERLRQVRFRFSANVNQIARVTGLSYPEVAQILQRPE